ncbi:acidic fibroblast growth factor intracellular-binding protein B-like [Actinia tenebrosa]|uniref:Acidic fibroblast growth factor intracellular-binding protein B-like n=1 Tax=Actinia tenebrosa TaxID=6105 RepID=A0A6P8IK74_ACTTE|nr:acidic fibroblast growth factor intracellular-binding protein B-like [Actinia tenebrosa]
MEGINVFMMDPTYVDLDVFALWLKGFSELEASKLRENDESLIKYSASHSVIFNDTKDHYRLFDMLAHFLQNPLMLGKQLLVQISPDTQDMLIQRYYSFDKEVMREILGKKLTGRQRKDLDDVCEKTKVYLKSCRRQFDNVKNVFRTIEDSENGNLVEIIKKNFLLSDELARQYASIVFMAVHRFEISKKRLLYLTFDDLAYCSEQIIENWTVGTDESGTGQDVGETGVEFDRSFLQDLRDLKVFVNDKDIVEEHRSLVCEEILKKGYSKLSTTVESNFKSFCRALLNIAASLIHSRDLKDIFNDFVEKFIEPCKAIEWQENDVDEFLTTLISTCSKLESLNKNDAKRLLPVYIRYFSVSQRCITRMYHS